MLQIVTLLSCLAVTGAFRAMSSHARQNSMNMKLNYGDFSSKAKSGLWMPSWNSNGFRMADPDVPPEVDPTRRFEPFIAAAYVQNRFLTKKLTQ